VSHDHDIVVDITNDSSTFEGGWLRFTPDPVSFDLHGLPQSGIAHISQPDSTVPIPLSRKCLSVCNQASQKRSPQS
jgi:hypothetical protein